MGTGICQSLPSSYRCMRGAVYKPLLSRQECHGEGSGLKHGCFLTQWNLLGIRFTLAPYALICMAKPLKPEGLWFLHWAARNEGFVKWAISWGKHRGGSQTNKLCANKIYAKFKKSVYSCWFMKQSLMFFMLQFVVTFR